MNEIEIDIDEILGLGWCDEEKKVIERLLKHFKSWKRWMPKHLEKDIKFMVDLAIKEKRKINELINI